MENQQHAAVRALKSFACSALFSKPTMVEAVAGKAIEQRTVGKPHVFCWVSTRVFCVHFSCIGDTGHACGRCSCTTGRDGACGHTVDGVHRINRQAPEDILRAAISVDRRQLGNTRRAGYVGVL